MLRQVPMSKPETLDKGMEVYYGLYFKTCGAVADEPGHLCSPCGDKAACSFCGAPAVDTAHMCKDKLSAMKYVCEGCGRVAMEEDHLCKAKPIA